MPEFATVRAMLAADLPAVHRLWEETEGVGLAQGDSIESLQGFLIRNPGASAVAIGGSGEIVAAVLAGHDGRRGFFYHLAVHAENRGQGIARALVDFSLATLREAGISKCTIVVYAHNESGEAFWQHLGWSPRIDLRVRQIAL